jgi:hypothetical protein
MKIQPDQITTVQQTGQVQSARSSPSQDFGAMLAKEVGSVQSTASAPPPGGVASLSQMVAAAAAQPVQGSSDTEKAVMDNVDNLLNQWEKYADQLASGSSGNLRQAYGTLENIQTGVQKLKDEYPDLSGQSPQLSSLVNELDVMTTTEQVKFNRGDYL